MRCGGVTYHAKQAASRRGIPGAFFNTHWSMFCSSKIVAAPLHKVRYRELRGLPLNNKNASSLSDVSTYIISQPSRLKERSNFAFFEFSWRAITGDNAAARSAGIGVAIPSHGSAFALIPDIRRPQQIDRAIRRTFTGGTSSLADQTLANSVRRYLSKSQEFRAFRKLSSKVPSADRLGGEEPGCS